MRNWPAYRRSAARLARFAQKREVFRVLGSHIEMKNEPRQAYPIGTTHQPNEHPLALRVQQVEELHAACEAMGDAPSVDVHDDFIIQALS